VLKRLKQREGELPCEGIELIHRRPGIVYKTQKNPGGLISHYSKPNHNIILSAFKLIAMVLDWNFGYWRTIRPGWAAGYLQIADRHSLLDILADPDRYRYGGPPGLVKLILKFTPQPPILILLDAPEKVLQGRKQELDPAQIARLRAGYLKIIRERPEGILIDSTQPVDNIVTELIQAISSHLAVVGHADGEVSGSFQKGEADSPEQSS
jgi:thymidylate kinase